MDSLPDTLFSCHVAQQIQKHRHIQYKYHKDTHPAEKQEKCKIQDKKDDIEKQKLSGRCPRSSHALPGIQQHPADTVVPQKMRTQPSHKTGKR